jgi:hypothetical protein
MKSNRVLSIVGGVLLVIGTGLIMKCEQIKAERDIAQAKFQKVLVEKSKGHEKAELNDSIVWEVNR